MRLLKKENLQLTISNAELRDESDLLKQLSKTIFWFRRKQGPVKKLVGSYQNFTNKMNKWSHMNRTIQVIMFSAYRQIIQLEKHGEELEVILKSFGKSSKRVEDILSASQRINNKWGLDISCFLHQVDNQVRYFSKVVNL